MGKDIMDFYFIVSAGPVVLIALFGAGFLWQQRSFYEARLKDKDAERERVERLMDNVLAKLMAIDFSPLHQQAEPTIAQGELLVQEYLEDLDPLGGPDVIGPK